MSFKKLALGAMVIAYAGVFTTQAMANNFVEGQDYTLLSKPQAVEKAGKIEVREFFWYGCPHCHALEPHMQTWLKKLPSDVRFVRTPAAMNPVWEVGAKAYFTSEALGIRQYTHIPLFEAHYAAKGGLSPKALSQFFNVHFKVPEDKFKETFDSFPVAQRVAQSKALTQAYGEELAGVPAVVVNGKYLVRGEDAKVPQVIDFLIEKERKAK